MSHQVRKRFRHKHFLIYSQWFAIDSLHLKITQKSLSFKPDEIILEKLMGLFSTFLNCLIRCVNLLYGDVQIVYIQQPASKSDKMGSLTSQNLISWYIVTRCIDIGCSFVSNNFPSFRFQQARFGCSVLWKLGTSCSANKKLFF